MNVRMKIRTEAHKDHEGVHHDGRYASTHSHKQNPPKSFNRGTVLDFADDPN